MTNILLMPQIDGSQTSFAIFNNADWVDNLYFTAPGYGPALTLTGCSLASGSNNIAVPSTLGIQPGMAIAPTPGLPNGAFVGAITSLIQLTAVSSAGTPVNATATTVVATLTFGPPPLDLSNINFLANLRTQSGNVAQIWLTAKTADGSMNNGGLTGVLSFNVPSSVMQSVPAGTYALDILAMADGRTVNLMANGPASVIVSQGISDAAL